MNHEPKEPWRISQRTDEEIVLLGDDLGSPRKASLPGGASLSQLGNASVSRPPPEPDLFRLLSVLRRRFRAIFTFVALGTALILMGATLIPRSYTAKALVTVLPHESTPTGGPTSTVDIAWIETQVAILTSHDVLQGTIDSLSSDPDFSSATLARADFDATRVLSGWISGRGLRSVSGPLSYEDLERHLQVGQERTSRVIGVSFTANSPERAAKVANRLVQLLEQRQLEAKEKAAELELLRINERIAGAKGDIARVRIEREAAVQAKQTQSAVTAAQELALDDRVHDLDREANADRLLYESLLRREKDIHFQEDSVTPDTTVLSLAAVPDRPSSANAILFIIPSVLVLAICSGMLAVIIDKADRTFRREQDIVDWLALPCHNVVPKLKLSSRLSAQQFIRREPFSPYSEAMRSIAADLHLAAANTKSQVVLVTSSVSKEGKTTLALSQAYYAARLGRRVVVIDLNVRRPALARELGSRTRKGISDLLLGNNCYDEILQNTLDPVIDFLPMLNCNVDPLMLFSNGSVPRLLAQLRETYDCIIIDGPPIIGAAETRLLAHEADKILFLVKWNATTRDDAASALSILRSHSVTDDQSGVVIDTALMQVDLKALNRLRA